KSSERNTPIPVGRFPRIPDSNESGKDTSSDYCALWRSPPAESSSHWRTQKKIEYRARKNRPGCPSQKWPRMAFTTLPTVWVATKGSCQTPSPEPAKEPASTRDHQSCAKHQEARARGAPEGCEPVVGPCVRCP